MPYSGDEAGRDQQVDDVALPPAEGVGGEAEEDVAEPLPEAHDDEPGGRLEEVEPAPALLHRQREVGGDPGEEPPVAEHAERVHGGGEQAVAAEVRAQEHAQRSRRSLSLAQPDLGLRHVLADPEDEQRGEDPDEEDSPPSEPGQDQAHHAAATISPMAQVDCMRPRALPRCSGRQVSAMSAAPVVHSPPMPEAEDETEDRELERPCPRARTRRWPRSRRGWTA